MMQELIIEDRAADRKMLFMHLYQEAFPLVARYVRDKGGSFEEAKDIFQDALVIYYEKLVTSNVELTYSERSYLLGIAKHLWAKKNKEHYNHITLDDSLTGIAMEDPGTTASDKLLNLLHHSGQRCMELLRAFYYDKLPMTKISKLFGFSSERSATVQKYKCLEKVRDLVKEKSLSYEDFLA
ncbi:RNA polymerase subunit sigma-70 [Niastella yeongjuensis]|uniref:RNA polymerase subunit sigma-70 n=1 Tax=Niastella yeongjuensis TaxID=354355 RepID=A0A1V9E9R0_9BACT|nr:sigma-70 family RNA polymerase sigma factor [Niastella yeongjuensis]OQP42714.1 RNA polymerase subunit sigma-70 [Niastella yeongjuensis]SEO50998.1 DNA-directed RNA polymerase specialized sigma subunit, sigma24 family [Niastella yeongjuensis]